VLSPTSEFFKYFGGKSSAAPAPSTPQGSQAKPPTTPAPGESRATPAEPANEAPTATP
jgi:hypothetical protein